MRKINLTQLIVYLDLSKRDKVELDIKNEFANLIYTNTQGIQAHALAYKIYNSTDEVELDDTEWSIFEQVMNNFCKPPFIDAINLQLENNK